MSSVDLDQLGLLLLQCMNGGNFATDVAYVKRLRTKHQLYGLESAEFWTRLSGLLAKG